MDTKNYGMRWFHFTYAVRNTLSLILSGIMLVVTGMLFSTLAEESVWCVLLFLYALIFRVPFHLAIAIGYFKSIRAGVYPNWLYSITLANLWIGIVLLIITELAQLNVGGIVASIVLGVPLTIAETVYFYHREFLYPTKLSEEEKLALEKQEEERRAQMIGKKVWHKKWGLGTILYTRKDNAHGEVMKVRFDACEKFFMYPAAIGTYLELVESNMDTSCVAVGAVKTTVPEADKRTVFEKIRMAQEPLWTKHSWQGSVSTEGKLTVGNCYGTKAQDIFVNCGKVFGWDMSQKGKFGMMQILYAKGAADKGMSPWFLAHHKWIDPEEKKANANWWNTVTKDVIYEEWKEIGDGFFSDFSRRITFVKTKKGYVYVGIFEPQKPLVRDIDPADGKRKNVKVYRLVQTDYDPFGEDCTDTQC